MPDDAIRTALEYFNSNKTECLADLKDLIRIPSVSFPGFEAAPVRQCAEAVAELLRKSGLTNVHLLESGEGYPSVFGEWTGAPGKQTILLYAHYDVQPVGREELWTTPPFEPAERGGRLYGRGSSDDKAGVSMLAVAVRSFLKSAGTLPVNVKVLIEGEEEVGSSNINEILKQNLGLLSADSLLIADSGNFDSGVPALTASLRGIVTVNVEVRSLTSSVHSGVWGGPVPDPVIALSKMIAGIADDEGRPAVPGILDKVRKLSPE
ncbi:MAG TPA: M20/M25/M40 family metallo-hydrolase, partial [Nitrospirota bacterium]|nr:M20/M25/M40 family metallo-hydrolase [Nitrospirota bacterium]